LVGLTCLEEGRKRERERTRGKKVERGV
jgi:hypothetical protein